MGQIRERYGVDYEVRRESVILHEGGDDGMAMEVSFDWLATLYRAMQEDPSLRGEHVDV